MRILITATAALFLTLSTSAFADEGKGVCKITVRTNWIDGHKNVKVEEVPAKDRMECKQLSDARRANTKPDEIASINTSFGFSNPE